MRETVLLINFNNHKQLSGIKSILMLEKILIREVSKEEYGQAIGALAGIKELYNKEAVYEGEDLKKEMMVFAGLSDTKLDKVLQLMRQRKVGKVDYKAVLTPMNITWTVDELYTELAKEHAVMSAKDKATI